MVAILNARHLGRKRNPANLRLGGWLTGFVRPVDHQHARLDACRGPSATSFTARGGILPSPVNVRCPDREPVRSWRAVDFVWCDRAGSNPRPAEVAALLASLGAIHIGFGRLSALGASGVQASPKIAQGHPARGPADVDLNLLRVRSARPGTTKRCRVSGSPCDPGRRDPEGLQGVRRRSSSPHAGDDLTGQLVAVPWSLTGAQLFRCRLSVQRFGRLRPWRPCQAFRFRGVGADGQV